MATTSDLYLSGTGALTTSGATTTLTNLFKLTGADNSIIDAHSCVLIVSNPSGSGQTITSGSLQFSDTVGSATSTLTYALPGTVSIAAGANQTFQIPLPNGILKNVTLSVTFGGTPSAGTLTVLLVLQTSGGLAAVQPQAGTSGGATPYSYISASGTNATSVKASSGTVYGISLTNTSTTKQPWFRMFDKASAPAVGTDTPILRQAIPAATSASQSSTFTISGPSVGIAFTNGIAFDITGGSGDNDTTSVGAGDVIVNFFRL